MTESISHEDLALNDVKKALNEIKNLLELIDLNAIHKEKIYLILINIDSYRSRLSNDMTKMKNDIILLNKKQNDTILLHKKQLDHPSAELDQYKDNLNKLVKLNIKLRQKEKYLDALLDRYFYTVQKRNDMIIGSFRMPVVKQYEEMDTIVIGEIESGDCRVDDQCLTMPNCARVEIKNIYYEDRETDSCVCAQNIRFALKNVEEVTIINHQSKIYVGYSAVLHIHATVVGVQLKILITLIDRKTGEETLENPKYIKQDQVAMAIFELSQSGQTICMELFEHFPRLGRFALCHEDRTVAVGKFLKIFGF
ncbi:unnamed protein product [Rotaria magnacalcarata]